MNRCILVLTALAMLHTPSGAQSQAKPDQQTQKRALRLLLEGDSSIAPYSFQELYKRGSERNCEISFAAGENDAYDARVILTSDAGSVWCSPTTTHSITPWTEWLFYGSAVVLMRNGKLLFTVSRSGFSGGAVRGLLIKELIDDFQVYYPTLKSQDSAVTSSVTNLPAAAPQDKPVEKTPAGLPEKPGVYYSAPAGTAGPAGLTRLSEVSVSRLRTTGAGKALLSWGLSEVRTANTYNGEQASTQIAEPQPMFLVRTIHAAVHDAVIIRLDKKKGFRELPITAVSLRGSKFLADDKIVSHATVDLIGNDVFRVIPKLQLKPGEYILRLAGSEDGEGYEFGVVSARK